MDEVAGEAGRLSVTSQKHTVLSVICLCLWLSSGSDNEYVYYYLQFTESLKKNYSLNIAMLELIVIFAFSVLHLVLFPCGII